MTWLDPILRPLALLAIRKGWLYPALADRLRHAYLAAAQADAGPDTTDSRLSVMTGLQRRDIARLRDTQTAAPKPHRQPLAEIIALWRDDPAYDPAHLPAQGDTPQTPSFTHLARRVRKDVHPRTFLDLLIQTGAVAENDGTLSLLTDAYIPQSGSDDQLAYLADNVGDHLATAVGNVTCGGEAYEVSVAYRGLNAAAVAKLDTLWRARMADAVKEVNDTARTFDKAHDGTQRFRAGAYFHSEDDVK